MISCVLTNGLGNNLFQIAATIAMGRRCNVPVHIPVWGYDKMLHTPLPKIDGFVPQDTYAEPTFSYRPIDYTPGRVISGYLQSEKYFMDFANDVAQSFRPSWAVTKKLWRWRMCHDIPNDMNNVAALHVRRGDYIHLAQFHANLGVDYYRTALGMLDAPRTVIVFSDDIPWCQSNITEIIRERGYEIVFEDGLYDYEAMYLMSECKQLVIANSTYAWWSAWLSVHPRIVIAPKMWFGPANSHININDIIPERWVTI